MPIDIMSAFSNEPEELDFVWPGFLAGTVGALVAPGGTGKSYFALQAAMSVACEEADLLRLKPKYHGQVVYLAAEDPEPVLIRRLHSIGQYLSPVAREIVAENLTIEPVLGKRIDIMQDRHLRYLADYCAEVRLIVLDTLSRFHSLDENSNSDMSRVVSALEYLADQTGSAILYLHHVSKFSARENQTDQQSARGAAALIDNARWCGFVAKMSESESQRLSDMPHSRLPIGDRRGLFVRFGVSKQNYDLIQADRWYERRGGGVLMPVELFSAKKGGERNEA